MAAMVLLTTIVGFIAVKVRFASVKSGEMNGKYFRLMQGYDVPNNVIQSTRNFNNQFEVPVLFYVVCTLYVSLHIENLLAIGLAWCFVGFRYIHAYIHLTYNKIIHRMLAFWLAIIMVLALWVNLLVHIH